MMMLLQELQESFELCLDMFNSNHTC